MKSLFSFLANASTKHRTLRGAHTIETSARKKLRPSDWLVIGVFGAVMTIGAALLFIDASLQLGTEVPTRGGTHSEGVIGNPRFINPLLATSETDQDITQLVFSGLLKTDPDGTFSLDVASGYEIAPDGLSYTFTLRNDVTFHDGTPVTAEDVVFSVSAAKNPEIKSPRRANWEGVDVIALDEHTVVFTLNAPYALFLENTTMGILPKHLLEDIRPEEFPFSEFNTNPVGSGPFRVEHIKKNSSGVPTEYRLRAFDGAAHPPFIRTFVFRFYPNQDALGVALESGAIDATHSIITENMSGKVLNQAVFGRVFGVFFNQNQEQLFTSEVVRRALDESVDKKKLVSTILAGYGTPLSGPLPPTTVASETEAQSGGNIDAARALLERSGWERDPETGIYQKESDDEGTQRLSFSLATGNASELRQAAELVAASWRELGAEVELQFFDTNDLNLEVIRPRKYDALLFGLSLGAEADLFAFWHASQRNDPGLNVALYANIVTDALLEEARKETDPVLRREKAVEAAAEIENDAAAVFLYAPHFLYLTERDLQGVNLGTVGSPSDRFFGVQNWYLKTERLWPLFQ